MCGRSWGRFYSLGGACSDYAFQRAVTSGCMMVDKVKLLFLNQPSGDCKILKQISHKIRRLSDYQSLSTRRRKACLSFALTATEFSSNNECFWDCLLLGCFVSSLWTVFWILLQMHFSIFTNRPKAQISADRLSLSVVLKPKSPHFTVFCIFNNKGEHTAKINKYIKQGIIPEKRC